MNGIKILNIRGTKSKVTALCIPNTLKIQSNWRGIQGNKKTFKGKYHEQMAFSIINTAILRI